MRLRTKVAMDGVTLGLCAWLAVDSMRSGDGWWGAWWACVGITTALSTVAALRGGR